MENNLKELSMAGILMNILRYILSGLEKSYEKLVY
jgi:hypothetical protein